MEDKNQKMHGKKFWLYIAIFVLASITLTLYALINWDQSKSASFQKTQEIEALLTREHSDEARAVILYFEQTWFNFEMHKDPEPYLRELLTGPLLGYYLKQINNQDSIEYWLIPGQTNVIDLKVVDYSKESMKVITCLNQGTDKITREGVIAERYPIRRLVKLFILIKAGGSWKIGNVIDMTDPKQALQEWDFMSQDLKGITGDIGSLVYNSCQTNK
jgi:hypothetical protein